MSNQQPFVPTLNSTGWMLSEPDQVMIDFAGHRLPCDLPCVDIGATFGVATFAALRAGKRMIAIDMDVRHLEELRLKLEKDSPEFVSHLEIINGIFPDEVSLPAGAVGGALLSRVMTFFSPSQVRKAVRTLHDWLTIGGAIYVSADSPNLKLYEKFQSEYERRLAAQAEWPGWIEDTSEYVESRQIAKSIHLFDPTILRREFERAGFEVEQSKYIDRKEYPPELQAGNESVYLIARKLA